MYKSKEHLSRLKYGQSSEGSWTSSTLLADSELQVTQEHAPRVGRKDCCTAEGSK